MQPGLQLAGPVGVRDQVDLDVHPRLGDRVRGRGRRVRERQDLVQLTSHRVAADHDDRVHHPLDLHTAAGQLGGDRVDQVRHVVGDDLHDGDRTGPPVVRAGRVEDAHGRAAGHPRLGELVVGPHRAQQVHGVVVVDFLGGHVAVVQTDEIGEFRRGGGSPFDQFIPNLLGAGRAAFAWLGTAGVELGTGRGSSRGHVQATLQAIRHLCVPGPATTVDGTSERGGNAPVTESNNLGDFPESRVKRLFPSLSSLRLCYRRETLLKPQITFS